MQLVFPISNSFMVKKQLEIERRKTCGPYCTIRVSFRLCSLFSVLFWLRKWYFLNFPPLCYRSSERAGASRLRSTHKKWVGGYFFSLSVGWQKNTLDFMGILRRRGQLLSPVFQALRWICCNKTAYNYILNRLWKARNFQSRSICKQICKITSSVQYIN